MTQQDPTHAMVFRPRHLKRVSPKAVLRAFQGFTFIRFASRARTHSKERLTRLTRLLGVCQKAFDG